MEASLTSSGYEARDSTTGNEARGSISGNEARSSISGNEARSSISGNKARNSIRGTGGSGSQAMDSTLPLMYFFPTHPWVPSLASQQPGRAPHTCSSPEFSPIWIPGVLPLPRPLAEQPMHELSMPPSGGWVFWVGLKVVLVHRAVTSTYLGTN